MDSMDLCNVQYSNYSFTCLEMNNSRENIGKFFFLSDTKDGGLYLNYNFQVKNKTFGKMCTSNNSLTNFHNEIFKSPILLQ